MIIISASVVVIIILMIRGSWVLAEMLMYFLSFLMVRYYYSSLITYEFFSCSLFADKVTFLLVGLSFLVGGFIISSSYNTVKFMSKLPWVFIILSFFIVVILSFSFFSVRLLYFYIFFEVVLIPIFLLVIGWGYQPERVQAGIYMLFYTLFASLPLLFIILFSYKDFILIEGAEGLIYKGGLGQVVTFLFIFAFLVKLPMFCVHLWLPKAHVEAPVAGSMILAALLLKLGGYGIWRVFNLVKSFINPRLPRVIMIGLLGGVFVRFVCFVQVDMKSLVAYSSVVHMGILLAGLRVGLVIGFDGALIMMVGHGLVSSGLFFLVGCVYDRTGRRSLLINKGIIIVFPRLTIIWFLLRIFNISAPPSLNLLREILLTTGALSWGWKTFFYLMVINFMGIVFTFY